MGTTFTLNLSVNSSITDAAFKLLPSSLTTFTLNLTANSSITDAAFKILPSRLTTFTLNLHSNSSITGGGLQAILSRQLEQFNCSLNNQSSCITPEVIEMFKSVPDSLKIELDAHMP